MTQPHEQSPLAHRLHRLIWALQDLVRLLLLLAYLAIVVSALLGKDLWQT